MVEAEAEETVDAEEVAEVQEATLLLLWHAIVGTMDPSAVTQVNSTPDVQKGIKEKQLL